MSIVKRRVCKLKTSSPQRSRERVGNAESTSSLGYLSAVTPRPLLLCGEPASKYKPIEFINHLSTRNLKNIFFIFAFCLLPFSFLLSACRQDMHDQPKYTTFKPSTFFEDGKSERSLVEGTVPRRNLRDDASLSDGDSNGGRSLGIDLASEPPQTQPVDLSQVMTP